MIELAYIPPELKNLFVKERKFIDEAKLSRYKNVLSSFNFAILLHNSRNIIDVNSFIKDIYSVYYE